MVLVGKVKHLVLFHYGLFDKICNKIKYLISKKSGITNSINYNFGRIKIDSYDSLLIKKILTSHNVIILIKPVVNKNQNKNYYNIFLEKSFININPISDTFKWIFMQIIKTLYYDRTDISERIDVVCMFVTIRIS